MTASSTLSVTELETERLLLRQVSGTDREGLIELFTDPEVRAHLGGPRPRPEVERMLDHLGTTHVPGSYAIADRETNEFLGGLWLDRRPVDVPGHVTEDGNELELSYALRRSAWGKGIAYEAAAAVLRAAADEMPDQPVVVVTQTANQRSMKLVERLGFRVVRTFEQFDAQQALGTASLYSFKA
ncbi:GNAT family N-acetyltransferase [Kibdelosporangium phytohabitans]|uniref:Acetyltransferase n=1 Tax=Kibdelosporangium phytohabitans TaxID=860235 RepID=A0A0N9IBI6_9PSEU|nr:GNAT family N-acetyltransferase [Kibdelosporangium phytohabitans]ALG13565.1 acetyltransferase [Kibdelosporangium phytohabitans]MBE1465431.1 RimJ/RimL family protein N-acetyltransferase [Kibdelosporangium phytohabitans]